MSEATALAELKALNFTNDDIQAFAEAYRDAAVLHAGQHRGEPGTAGASPYIEHPLRVAMRLAEWGVKDAGVIIAGLLHDTVEDCSDRILDGFYTSWRGSESAPDLSELSETDKISLALEWIESKYGARVRDLVDAVTNRPGTDYDSKIYGILSGSDPEAILIKASDLVDNAGSLERQRSSFNEEKLNKLIGKYQPQVTKFIEKFDRDEELSEYTPAASQLKEASLRLKLIQAQEAS